MKTDADIDVRLIVPIVESIEETFDKFFNIKIERGRTCVLDIPFHSRGIGAIVKIIGDFNGKLFLDMLPNAACRLASLLLKKEMPELDETVISTVGEILNIITGDASTKIIHYGNVNISTPEIITARDVSNKIEHKKVIIVPLGFESHILNVIFYLY